ncbi:hypothetical protein VHUM_03054 [Vanrija humicola]|uniref:Carboxylic ester hydrolase n=1 Tax=Vanrija humicola TaxID=5417 RepID=A0A7D8UYI0_VANHU|nr:hypothetical protein VHUM_03054 [Vanrija humicola]
MQAGVDDIDEDCLTLTITAPKGAANSKARLPVMVWIYGGGFVQGSQVYYNDAALVPYSIVTDQPVVLVTINYRVGIWGFGYGKEIEDAGAANLGHRDQILALQWVQKHIRKFGGCKNKVTVFGQSAGAISIANLLLKARVDDKRLFRGAIRQSGAASSAPLAKTGEAWQGAYDALVAAAGCNDTCTHPDSLDCLRQLDAGDLLKAQVAMRAKFEYSLGFVFGPSIDGDIIPDSPAALLHAGKVAKVPFITGTTKDEGTAFIPQSGLLATPGAANIALGLLYPATPAKQLADGIFQRWPADPAQGAPFGTGSDLFGLPAAFKQLSAAITDIAFNSRRRWLLRNANLAGNAKTWSYFFNATGPCEEPQLGSEWRRAVWEKATDRQSLLTHPPTQAHMPTTSSTCSARRGPRARRRGTRPTRSSCRPSSWTIGECAVVRFRRAADAARRLNFAYNADPNGECLPEWPAHRYPDNKNSLRVVPGDVGVLQDDFREAQMDWMNDSAVAKGLYMRDGAAGEVTAELRRMSA